MRFNIKLQTLNYQSKTYQIWTKICNQKTVMGTWNSIVRTWNSELKLRSDAEINEPGNIMFSPTCTETCTETNHSLGMESMDKHG